MIPASRAWNGLTLPPLINTSTRPDEASDRLRVIGHYRMLHETLLVDDV